MEFSPAPHTLRLTQGCLKQGLRGLLQVRGDGPLDVNDLAFEPASGEDRQTDRPAVSAFLLDRPPRLQILIRYHNAIPKTSKFDQYIFDPIVRIFIGL